MKNGSEKSQIPAHYELIGDMQENFYRLGVKDRNAYKQLRTHLNALFSTKSQAIDFAIQKAGEVVSKLNFSSSSNYKGLLLSYAQGLEVKEEEVIFSYLLPELSSCLSKWVPNLSQFQMGCSSMFYLEDTSKSLSHMRILDFALVNTFDKFERTLSYQCDNSTKVFAHTSGAMPFHAVTAMNEHGLTMALHQKFTETLDMSGQSIFDIGHNLMNECRTIEDCESFLKKSKSITTWALYIGQSDGQVLACDISGDQHRFEKQKLTPNKVIYYNNQLLDKNINQEDLTPYGINPYNLMREKTANTKIKTLESGPLTDTRVLKTVATPLNQKSKSIKNWNMDIVTPTSLHIVTMNPEQASSYSVAGAAPKYLNKELIHYENCFSIVEKSFVKLKNHSKNNALIEGMKNLSMAQSNYDLGDIVSAYHFIQLAIKDLKGYPEGNIAQFYFLVYQFIHEPHRKLRSFLLDEFNSLSGNLPPFLDDQNKLFISRLERMLSGKTVIKESDFKFNSLKEVFKVENSIPDIALHQMLKRIIAPRLDTLDVIYPHLAKVYGQS